MNLNNYFKKESPLLNMLGMGGGVGSSLVSGGGITPEDILSIDSYTGNETARSITTNIDLSGEGGLVWIKSTTETKKNLIFDTVRGANKYWHPGSVAIQVNDPNSLTEFNSDGFNLGTDSNDLVNSNLKPYAAVSIRQLEGFLNIVTWTGNGSSSRNISHSLNSTPELMIIKNVGPYTDSGVVYHKDVGNTKVGLLADSDAFQTDTNCLDSTTPTSSVFTVGNDDKTNRNGMTYVAYLFSTLSDFCKIGSYTGNGSTNSIDCSDAFTGGPRFVMIKNANRNNIDWRFYYNIVSGNDSFFLNDSNSRENTAITNSDTIDPVTSGGFSVNGVEDEINRSGDTYVFWAIK